MIDYHVTDMIDSVSKDSLPVIDLHTKSAFSSKNIDFIDLTNNATHCFSIVIAQLCFLFFHKLPLSSQETKGKKVNNIFTKAYVIARPDPFSLITWTLGCQLYF